METILKLPGKICLMLILCISGAVVIILSDAGLVHAGPDMVLVQAQAKPLLIVPKCQLLKDASKTRSFDEIRRINTGWQTPGGNAFNFGYSSAVYWGRWRIANGTQHDLDMVIDLGNPREDHVTWYLIREQNLVERFETGDRHVFQQRPLKLSRNFALPLFLSAGEAVEVYVHMKSHDGFFEPMPVILYHEDAFFQESNLNALLLTLYHGGLLFLLFYNFLIYFSTREPGFLLYSAYMACLLMWNFTVNGFSFQYLWPHSPVFNNHFLTYCSAYAFGMFGLFTIEYLKLKTQAPKSLVTTIKILAGLNFATILPAFWDYYAFSVAYGQVVGVAMTAVTLGTGIYLLAKGQRQARFFMAAFTMLGTGATVYILKIIGIAPTNLVTTWGLQFGSAFEALILALGLADSMNRLKEEKLDAERRAKEAKETLARGLEKEVRQRTEELAKANSRLKELAITDELTGAYNRRHFSTICSAALNHKQRQEPLGFCMFDIDYFKQYNDRYGHSAGDHALQQVSQAIKKLIKRSTDALFRLGGEEFGVLFTAYTPEHAKDFAEQMRKHIQALNILHEDSKEGVLTASFGLTHWDLQADVKVEVIYAQTDAALYKAKHNGRNQVVAERLPF